VLNPSALNKLLILAKREKIISLLKHYGIYVASALSVLYYQASIDGIFCKLAAKLLTDPCNILISVPVFLL